VNQKRKMEKKVARKESRTHCGNANQESGFFGTDVDFVISLVRTEKEGKGGNGL